jgi:hypothetical protein
VKKVQNRYLSSLSEKSFELENVFKEARRNFIFIFLRKARQAKNLITVYASAEYILI